MFFYTFGNKITRCIDCYVVLGVDKELVGQHGAGVQGARDEEIKADPAALRHLQDRLGLDDSALYVLHRHHRTVQRRVRHDVRGRLHSASVHRQ